MIDRTKNLVLPLHPFDKLLLIALGIFLLFSFHPQKIYAQEKTATQSAVFQLPHPGYITTTFSSFHPGIDICTGLGMPIKPISEGIVSDAGFNFWGLGLFVEVDHGNGFKSLYAHMGKIYVTKGTKVGINDLLGVVGLTGNTTGPHTHLELSYNGQRIDPRPHLPELRDYPKEEDFAKIESSTPSAYLVPESTRSATLTSVALIESTPSSNPTISTSSPQPSATPTPAKTTIEDFLKKQSDKTLQNTLSIVPSPTTIKTIPSGGKYDLKNLLLH